LEHFETEDFVHDLAYLGDTFNRKNEIHLSVHDPGATIKVAFKK
jgi:hypothetical protein